MAMNRHVKGRFATALTGLAVAIAAVGVIDLGLMVPIAGHAADAEPTAQQILALTRAYGYDWQGKLLTKFEVRSVQKTDDGWILKQMRIQRMDPGTNSDSTPTYLEIEAG